MSANREGDNYSVATRRVWGESGLLAEEMYVYYWANVVDGPSDCLWIVPGSYDYTTGEEQL